MLEPFTHCIGLYLRCLDLTALRKLNSFPHGRKDTTKEGVSEPTGALGPGIEGQSLSISSAPPPPKTELREVGCLTPRLFFPIFDNFISFLHIITTVFLFSYVSCTNCQRPETTQYLFVCLLSHVVHLE